MLPQWFWKPEVLYPTLLAVALFLVGTSVSVLASAYPEKTKRMLTLPGRGMNRSVLKHYEIELDFLERIHDNSYQMTLWLAWSVMSILRYLFWMWFLVGAISLAFLLKTGRPLLPSFGEAFLVATVGKGWEKGSA